MSWYQFNNGKSIGHRGSENGIVIRDEEHAGGARITLEQGGGTAPLAITCGIYGWMVHTRFFGAESEAQTDFENMKAELNKIIDLIPLTTDREVNSKKQAVVYSISQFVQRFP